MSTCRIVRIMDLDPDPASAAGYDGAHSVGQTPTAVIGAQHEHGIVEMQIFQSGDRLVMILELADDFDAAGLERAERDHPEIAAWQIRMAALQRAPFPDGEPWPEAHRVFRQSDHLSGKDRT